MSKPPEPAVAIVGPQDVAAWRAGKPEPLLLDVREAWEFEQGHIEGAENLPLSLMPANLGAFKASPGQRIVTYCHHGVRSQRAAALLQAAGHTPIWSMAGGIDAWATEVDASVGRY